MGGEKVKVVMLSSMPCKSPNDSPTL
jgi:hypothetical protein